LALTGLLFLVVLAAVSYLPVRRYLDRAEVERARALPPAAVAAPVAAAGMTGAVANTAPLLVAPKAPAVIEAGPGDPEGDTCVLRFDVRDAVTDAVLPEVHYRLYRWDEEFERTAVASGRHDLVFPLGQEFAFYAIGAPGFATVTWRVNSNELRPGMIVPVKAALPAGRTIAGQLINASGTPVPDAVVRLYTQHLSDADEERVNYSGEARTDANGRWRLEDVPPDCTAGSVQFTHPEYVSDPYGKRPLRLTSTQDRVDVLETGRPFRGRVVDLQGNGVAGATLGFRGFDAVPAESNTEGAFMFPHVSEDYFDDDVLVVRAPGHGSVYRDLRLSDWTEDFQVVLSPCVPLWIQFQDQRGRPLANAHVFISFENAAGRQVGWEELQSGEDGAITLEEVPTSVSCKFSAWYPRERSYRNPERMILPADGTPMQVRLRPVPKVTILAKDAVTGQPLESFYVTQGSAAEAPQEKPWWARIVEWRNEPPEIYWDFHTREPASRVFERSFDAHSERPVYYRIEAAGYWPKQTPVFKAQGDDTYFVVALERGDAPRILPVDAAGQAVAGARAAWLPVDGGLRIYDGRPLGRDALWAMEDAESGWLQLQPVDTSTHALVVLSEYGMAIEPGHTVRTGTRVPLVPWGRLEGTLGAAAAQMAGGGVRARLRASIAGLAVQFDGSDRSPSETQFTIERLYPGTYWVAPEGWLKDDGHQHYASLPWTTATIAAGETGTVSLTGGRAVKLQLDLAPAQLAWLRKAPAFLPLVREDAPEGWPHAEVYMKTGAAGEAAVAALPPGKYALRDAYLLDPDLPKPGQVIRYWLEPVQFEIADDPATHTTPLDLGVVKVVER
jgi:hypothetical protein